MSVLIKQSGIFFVNRRELLQFTNNALLCPQSELPENAKSNRMNSRRFFIACPLRRHTAKGKTDADFAVRFFAQRALL
jgi:hypothetical protein